MAIRPRPCSNDVHPPPSIYISWPRLIPTLSSIVNEYIGMSILGLSLVGNDAAKHAKRTIPFAFLSLRYRVTRRAIGSKPVVCVLCSHY